MGIFDSISNKFKFSNKIDKGNGFALGVYRNREKTSQGLNALLFGDKVLAEDVLFASDNFQPTKLYPRAKSLLNAALITTWSFLAVVKLARLNWTL